MKFIGIGYLLLINLTLLGQDKIDCDIKPDSRLGILSYSNTVNYINNYYSNHSTSIDQHTQAIYFNNALLKFIGDFFREYPDYLGLQFTSINYIRRVAPGQNSKKQVLLALAPIDKYDHPDNRILKTYYKKKGREKYRKNELNRNYVCPGKCDDSLFMWTQQPESEYNDDRVTSLTPNRRNSERFSFIKKNSLSRKVKRFKKNQGVELDSSQTLSVFFGKKTFEMLNKFISVDNNNEVYPIFGMYSISYNYLDEDLGMKHENQTSYTFIPLKLDINKKYQPQICEFISFLKNNQPFFAQLSDKEIKSLNHGEICPQVCHPQ